MSDATRETVNAVAEIVSSGESHASNAQLAKHLGLDKAAVSRRVRVAINQGYLRNDEDRRGKPSKIAPADPLPEDVEILPTVDVLTLHERGDMTYPHRRQATVTSTSASATTTSTSMPPRR